MQCKEKVHTVVKNEFCYVKKGINYKYRLTM